MNHLIIREYSGMALSFQVDGWFNATQAAAKYSKRPNDWLALQSTKDYVAAVALPTTQQEAA